MRILFTQSLYFSLLFPIVFSGCVFDSKVAKRGSVVENEVLTGLLFTELGKPAEDANVKMFSVGHVANRGLIKAADTLEIFAFKTDSLGRFKATGLPPGEYNILGNLDGTYSYQDSVIITEETVTIPPDTLRNPGSITGMVALEPNHDPRTVFIQILGTDYFANADSSGRFTFKNISSGQYSIRIMTTLEGYSPYFGGFGIRAGKSDTLPDAFRLIYTGIPVVRGLSVTYDTARAVARISWSPANYPFLQEYVLYRNEASNVSNAPVPVAELKDTVYEDDLNDLTNGPGREATDSTLVRFEYRVRVRNLSDEQGPTFGSVEVDATPIAAVRTDISFSMDGGVDGKASIGDTVKIVAKWSNPTRLNKSLQWIRTDGGESLKKVTVEGRQGSDTLNFPLPNHVGSIRVEAQLQDDAGTIWSESFLVSVLKDEPTAYAGPDTNVTISDTVRLKGKGSDKFGKIVKLEWNIGNKGVFITSARGDTSVVASSVVGEEFHVFRVTDDDGNSVMDTVRIIVRNDIPKLEFAIVPRLASLGGGYQLKTKVSDFGRIVKWEWDFGTGSFISGTKGDTTFVPVRSADSIVVFRTKATDDDGNWESASAEVFVSKWNLESQSPLSSSWYMSATELDGKFYVVGAEFSKAKDQPAVAVFNPSNTQWTLMPFPGNLVQGEGLASANGKLYVLGGSAVVADTHIPGATVDEKKVWEFDPKLNEWSRKKDMVQYVKNSSIAVLNGKIYVLGGTNRGREFEEYDPSKDSWTAKLKFPGNAYDMIALAELNGRLYAIGGRHTVGSMIDKVYMYDPESDKWTEKSPLPYGIVNRCAVSLGGKIYVVGTYAEQNNGPHKKVLEYDPILDHWTEKSPHLLRARGQSAAVIEGKIYSIGEDAYLQSYNPLNDQ